MICCYNLFSVNVVDDDRDDDDDDDDEDDDGDDDSDTLYALKTLLQEEEG